MKSQATVSPVFQLQKAIQADLVAAQKRASFLVAIFLVIFAILIIAISLWINRSIGTPIAKLERGTQIIGSGNLDHKVGIDAKDEIGQLSRAFDKMTGDLKETTASITELNKEIAERKQAEEELRRERDKLQDALDKIRTLSGMLPICSNCKKIRDDKGYWNQIESYIAKHSEVDFSHSICPECAKKLYPDFYKGD